MPDEPTPWSGRPAAGTADTWNQAPAPPPAWDDPAPGWGGPPPGPPPGPAPTSTPAGAPGWTPGWGPGSAPPPRAGNTLSIIALVCAAVAVLFVPPLFGLAAIVLGAVAMSRHEPLGRLALALGVVGLFVGLALGLLVAHTLA